MSARNAAAVESELAEVEAIISAAYWRFSRQRRAAPPSSQVPEAYRRRAALTLELREIRRAERAALTCPTNLNRDL